MLLDAVPNEVEEMLPTSGRALIQGVNNQEAPSGRILYEEIEESVGKGFVARVLAAIVTCFVELPGRLGEILVMFAQLPDEASEHRVRFLGTLVTEVEVVVCNAGPRFCLAVFFDVIDNCRTNDLGSCAQSQFSRAIKGREEGILVFPAPGMP